MRTEYILDAKTWTAISEAGQSGIVYVFDRKYHGRIFIDHSAEDVPTLTKKEKVFIRECGAKDQVISADNLSDVWYAYALDSNAVLYVDIV